MARDRIPIVVLGNDGRPLAGATVTVRNHPAGTTATVYSDDTSGATLANPLTSDARGGVAGWVDRGMYAATLTASGFGPYVEYFSASPAGAGAIDNLWIADNAADLRVVAEAILDAYLPIGARIGYAGAGDPAAVAGGPTWMLCDGRALVRATFGALFTAIGTTYGVGNGSTTFNLPDFRGRGAQHPINMGTAAGAGPNANDRTQLARGAVAGEVAHTIVGAELPGDVVTHTGIIENHNVATSAAATNSPRSNGGVFSSNGLSTPANNLQPLLVENALIRVA